MSASHIICATRGTGRRSGVGVGVVGGGSSSGRRRRRIGLSTLFVFMAACFVFITQILHRLLIGRGGGITMPSTEYNVISSPGGGIDSFQGDGRDGIIATTALHDRDGMRRGKNRRRRGSTASASYYRHSHPRVVDVSNLQSGMESESKFGSRSVTIWGYVIRLFGHSHAVIDDPMSVRRDDWPSNVTSSSDGAVYDTRDGGVVVEDGEEMEDDEDQDGSKCVPMATWQTTSYPNCNTVHEIDMVRSSGMGSYAFPKSSPFATTRKRHEGGDDDENTDSRFRRRSITSHPPMKRKNAYLERILRGKRGEPKMNNEGLLMEGSVKFLGQGWFRSGWETRTERIPEYDIENGRWGIEETVVFKTLRFEREFRAEYYELHRRDALAMERLTFSPYVINVYGYCGQSAINELADYDIEGMTNLEKVSRSFRGMMDIEPVSVIRLRLAYMVAAGVSHIHSIDYPDVPPIPVTVEDDGKAESFKSAVKAGTRVKSNATLVHYDLNPRNVAVVKRGIPKLNDFNVAEFMTWDAKPDRPCGFRGRFREPWWRSPEEMHYHLPNYTNPVPLTEKVDIYSLGNILWTILTTHSPWKMVKGEAEERTRPKVARGVLPNWPDDFDHTKLESDPALMAINLAMRRCLRFNPEERPTAGEIAAELNDAIENLPVGFGDKEKWKNEMMTRANTTNQTG